MVSDVYITIFTFLMISIAVFSGFNLLDTVSPPNSEEISDVNIIVGNEKYPIYTDKIPVNHGDKIKIKVNNKNGTMWVESDPIRNNPDIKIQNNRIDTIQSDCNPNFDSSENYYNENNIDSEKYRLTYSGKSRWVEFYCTKY